MSGERHALRERRAWRLPAQGHETRSVLSAPMRILRCMPRNADPSGWDPWQYLATRLSDWHVCLCDLPVLGALDWARRTIHLDRTMDAAERRCTLAHEIGHILRGDTGACTASVEQRIEEGVARALIPLDDLVDALRWGRHVHEVAEDLAVDDRILAMRIERSSAAERTAIRAAVRRRCDAA